MNKYEYRVSFVTSGSITIEVSVWSNDSNLSEDKVFEMAESELLEEGIDLRSRQDYDQIFVDYEIIEFR